MAVITLGRAARTAEKCKGSIGDGGAAARRKPDVAEVHSPPRVTAVAAKYKLQRGWSLDLTTADSKGVAWDF
eukprot:3879524-Heterocapsa_arctica.AAC.1